MELNITFRHMESTPSIESKIEQKAQKLKKYFRAKIYVDWICICEKENHQSDVTVRTDHFSTHASAHDHNLYKTFDSVISKLEKQLSKKNEQVRGKMHGKGKLSEQFEEEKNEPEDEY